MTAEERLERLAEYMDGLERTTPERTHYLYTREIRSILSGRVRFGSTGDN